MFLSEHVLYGSSRLGTSTYNKYHMGYTSGSLAYPTAPGFNVCYTESHENEMESGREPMGGNSTGPIGGNHEILLANGPHRVAGTRTPITGVNLPWAGDDVNLQPTREPTVFAPGRKRYEFSNHLGNVLVTLSDMPLGVDVGSDGDVDYYMPDVKNSTAYEPFGRELDGYTLNEGSSYRWGMNTQMKDDEIYGPGNSYSAEFWQYDPRTGRRWNIDPVVKEWESPYATFNNNPILMSDPNGDDSDPPGKTYNDPSGNSVTLPEGTAVTLYEKDTKVIREGYERIVKAGTLKSFTVNGTEYSASFGVSRGRENVAFYGYVNAYNDEWAGNMGWAESAMHGFKRSITGNYDDNTNAISRFYKTQQDVETIAAIFAFGRGIFKVAARSGPKLGFKVFANKFDYFFGRVVTGNAHNISRSAQNLNDLKTMGITNGEQLLDVFTQAFESNVIVNTKTSQYGVTITKSANIGNKGAVHVGFFYPKGNMTETPSVVTIIPKVNK